MSFPRFPRALLRRMENENFPLIALQAVAEARRALDEIEVAATIRAKEMGASAIDIAQTLGLTRQAVHHRLRMIQKRSRSSSVRPAD